MEFLEAFADFYGEFSLDEVADRLGLPTIELVEYFEDLVDENSDDISEEMSYNELKDEEDDEEEV
jgi:hypothetical protein